MDNYQNKNFKIPITPRTMVFCEHRKFRHLMYLGMQCILSWQVDKTWREHSRVQMCIRRYSHSHRIHNPIVMHYCVDTGMMQFDTVQDTFHLPSSEPMQCRGSSRTNHQPCHSKAANYFITHLFRIQLYHHPLGAHHSDSRCGSYNDMLNCWYRMYAHTYIHTYWKSEGNGPDK